MQSPLGSQPTVLPPQQTCSTPQNNNSPEIDKSPKPALPPKPAIKPPPRQTQVVNEETVPPPLPATEPPDDKTISGKTNPETKQGKDY